MKLKNMMLKQNDVRKQFTVVWIVCVLVALNGAAFAEAGAPGGQSDGGKAVMVNINTGNSEQLQQLPRVGQKTAERIIEYRQKNGKFKSPQEIMKVKGIGEKTYKKMEKMITV